MTPCLRPEEFVDALDGSLAPARRAHLESCAPCRQTLADLRAAWAAAQADGVPDPSPFFWPAVNARVRAAIADERRTTHTVGGAWSAWRRWTAVAPLGGLALLVVALVWIVGRPGAPPMLALDDAYEVSPAGAPDADADPALALVVDLASGLDEDVDPLGLQTLPDLGDAAAATLSPDEQDALRTLLRSAVERPPS